MLGVFIMEALLVGIFARKNVLGLGVHMILEVCINGLALVATPSRIAELVMIRGQI
jgi:hypothetical protein